MSEKDIESMSDEEILEMEPPAIENEEPKEEATEEVPEQEQQEQTEEAPSQESPDEGEEEEEEETKEEEPPQQQPEVDYKGFYEQVMAPFKANGNTVQLRSPQEVVKLMQMGANYTQKMQHLAPYRKKVQMLQKANLLDDDKLNYLIDLSQGNPEAIKKLIRDSKLDPMDLDIYGEQQQYVPGNHTVSDAEMQLQTTLDELTSTPEGLQTVNLARGWDQASLSEIGKDPSILATLHEQRMNGVYDFITKEMQHQKMLGNLPDNIPFLQAYKAVGDFCLQQLQQKQQQQQQAVANLPKGTLNQGNNTNNSAQVKSAAPSGRSRKAASTFVDPFSLSDEEFEKQFANYA